MKKADIEKQQFSCPLQKQGCGGCPMLALPYEEQLRKKQKKIKRLLGNFGKPRPIIGMENPWHYRNKAIASFTMQRGRLAAGIYAAGTHRVLPLPEAGCLLQAPILDKTIAAVVAAARAVRWPAYDEDRGTGLLRHILVRVGVRTGQVMAILVTASDRLPGSRQFVAALRREAPWLTTLIHNHNPRRTSAVLGRDVRVLFGPGSIEDELCGLRFAITPGSFYQVNHDQTERLYRAAIAAAGLTGGETILDAYCGIGTIGLCAAGQAGRLIGVEQTPAAVRAAKANATANRVANAQFFCADATAWMRRAAAEGLRPDVVFLDPPRAGSTPEAIAAIAAMAPRKVIYISCGPESLARDLQTFARHAYRPSRFRPVDLFPHTEHLETVVLLSKGEIDSKKVRVEFSLEDMDMSGFQKGATYEQIKAYVLEKFELKVSSLYISQIKRKCGLDVGQNYNLSKKENAKVPKCPPEKEAAIMDALKYFQMIM